MTWPPWVSRSTDGDTGLFAEGGQAHYGSDLVVRLGNAEVGRFRSAQVVVPDSFVAGGKHNGVKSPNLLFNGSGEFGNACWELSNFTGIQGTFGEGAMFLNNSAITAGESIGDISTPIMMGEGVDLAFSCMITAVGLTAGRVYVDMEAFDVRGASLGAFIGTESAIAATNKNGDNSYYVKYHVFISSEN